MLRNSDFIFWIIPLIGFIHGCLFTTKYTVTIMGHCMSYFATNKLDVFRKRSNRIRYVFYLVRPEGKISKSIFKASGSSSQAILRAAGRWHSGFLILSNSNKLQLLKC